MQPLLSKICVFLSFVTLGNIGLQTFYHQTADTYRILNNLDNIICVVFLIEWFSRLYTSTDRKGFMKWGWVDLTLSIPVTHATWAAYSQVLRFVRCIRSAKFIFEFLDKDHKTSKFFDCCVFCIAFVIFSAIVVFNCEKHVENANIKNLSDSIWWSMATITTIGYGDRYPVSDLGRFVGGIVMIGGVGLYASFTGFVVSRFITDERIDVILSENREIKKLLIEMQKPKE